MKRLFIILNTLTMLMGPLPGQQIQLVLIQPDVTDTLMVQPAQLDSILESSLAVFSASGYWDAVVELSTDETKPGFIKARINPGIPVSLRYVHFSGLKDKDSHYLKKEFKMGKSTISSNQIPLAESKITDLGYQLSRDAQLTKDSNGDYHMDYEVNNFPEMQAQGLASFNRSGTADTIAWYGQINVNIPNFDGKGKSFDFSWERLKSNSESFNLGLRYPWIFELPISGTFQFGREVINGNYQIVQTSLGLEWDLDWQRSIHFSYEKNESIITHEGALLFPEWEPDKKRLLGLGYRQSNLNAQVHRGLSLKTMLFQEMNFEPEAIRKFTLRSEAQINLVDNLFVSQRTRASIQNHSTSQSDPSILVPLGGVNSVRGYEEAYLRSPNTISMQNTLHLMIGSQSQILAFYDIGLHNADNDIDALQGYGLGIQLRSGRGPIRLILASHKGVKLSNSFFHIEYSGGISWIDQ
ncbi:MAG: BamA/TamA family outer membrane protein [Candidatus Marinimicrobia bacterium]|jgi:outer membrane protein assembly factor BamA|nr:BamA/TamA family outer membrane protein [Candidatus Neomarinimicrobiota bacterium]MBT3630542.1 BamA/TamA family outer membrane protein [Candidatus Neomarinimicrobiota bacterium]MBT3823389.1 BamA/TamA family outer membrane protein [Candidatus Neomarinimicrobiota bacterium]MBT4131454.1 BamA/TamA family outer membrane protein [Candidatus Neomarinimicrobiota bacterium]MBT4295829.1 BamA/TamA family outer membrane protein [Candidatus Neomarinimicrobiota bacterium]